MHQWAYAQGEAGLQQIVDALQREGFTTKVALEQCLLLQRQT
jgi:hypothetical protein